jgi:hypothetical protein
MPVSVSGTTITFNDASTLSSNPIPAGSVMLFYQAAAPTGWTKVTTQDNKALRVVSGTGGVAGGTTAFSSVFANQTPTITTSGLSAGATTLTTAQIPSHTHSYTASNSGNVGNAKKAGNYYAMEDFAANSGTFGANTGSAGTGGSHTHPVSGSATSSAITLNVQYIDIILCSKN